MGLARKGGEATEQGGGVDWLCKDRFVQRLWGGVLKALRSPKSSKGAATGSSRAEGD